MQRDFEKDRVVTVFGGSGFLGRHVVRALAARGWRIRVAVRRPHLAQHLQPLGTVGQIQAIQANLRVPWSVERALSGADAAVNLVGILAESGVQRFDAVHAAGAATAAGQAAAAGIASFVQVSSIGADPDSPSAYARSKAEGERAVTAAIPGAVILRPSVVFGPEDSFFNRFAAMARLSPVLPLVGGATRFQPVFVGDVAEAVVRAVEGAASPDSARAGTVYELGGPEVRTFRECLELMLREIGRKRLLLPLPAAIARPLGSILELLPGQLLTADQVIQLSRDNVVSEAAVANRRTLAGLGILPTAMASVLPSYLWRFRPRGQFEGRSTA